MTILLTGSSGLLGSDIAVEARRRAVGFIGACRNTMNPEDISADICTDEGIAKIASLPFDCIVHTAAWRNPDECEADKAYCRKINVEATAALAKIAKRKKAFFLHISTDYVFSGENPPYDEDSEPCPVNYYGETKAEAEEIVRSLPAFTILRVPLLYGLGAGLAKSALLKSMVDALKSGRPWNMEDSIVRFPTYTGDVANAVFFLLEKNAAGIFHFSGQDKTSRYRMTLDFAEAVGLSAKNIVRLAEPPHSEARRPLNSQLSMRKILSMGFPPPLPFKERIKLLMP